MKKSVNETLKQAVEQLFVRVHLDLLETICDKTDCPVSCSTFDSENPSHLRLVNLSKEKIGFEPAVLNEDIFSHIIQVFSETKVKEKEKLDAKN